MKPTQRRQRRPAPAVRDADRIVRLGSPTFPVTLTTGPFRDWNFSFKAVIDGYSALDVNDAHQSETAYHCVRHLGALAMFYCARRDGMHSELVRRALAGEALEHTTGLMGVFGSTNKPAVEALTRLIEANRPKGFVRNLVRELSRLEQSLLTLGGEPVRVGRPSDDVGNEFVRALVPIFRALTRRAAIGRLPSRSERHSPEDVRATPFGEFVSDVEQQIFLGALQTFRRDHPDWSDAALNAAARRYLLEDKSAAISWARKHTTAPK